MGYYICLELGGTYIRSCVWDVQRAQPVNIQKKRFFSGHTAMQEVDINLMDEIHRRVAALSLSGLKGIGISSAAICDRRNGTIIHWPNHLLWNGFALKKHIAREFSIPIVIEDDINCAAWGEYTFKKAEFCRNLVCISVGTGVGCGLILNKELYIGDNGLAGELGHTTGVEKGVLCNCGNFDCLQTIASGPAIVSHYNQCNKTNYTQLEQIYALAKNGNEKAILCIKEGMSAMATAIFNLLMILDVDMVVIGGGAALGMDWYIEEIAKQVNKKLQSYHKSTRIEAANLGEDSGLWGIGRLVHKTVYGE